MLKSYDFAKQNAKESHEFAKQNAKEMKKALANCYHEVVKGNKRMESSEGTLKELIQGQAATNKLILDLAAKFDAFQEEKQPYKTIQRPAHRAYCTFCRNSAMIWESVKRGYNAIDVELGTIERITAIGGTGCVISVMLKDTNRI